MSEPERPAMTEQRISDETPWTSGGTTGQRVGDDVIADRVREIEAEDVRAEAAGEPHGNYGEEYGAVLYDLRDARAALAEAQRENVRLKELLAEARDVRDIVVTRVRDERDELEQHVAALRDALEEVLGDEKWAWDRARAILTDTAAGSAAWLAARDEQVRKAARDEMHAETRVAFDAGHCLGFVFGVGFAGGPEAAITAGNPAVPTAAEADRAWADWQRRFVAGGSSTDAWLAAHDAEKDARIAKLEEESLRNIFDKERIVAEAVAEKDAQIAALVEFAQAVMHAPDAMCGNPEAHFDRCDCLGHRAYNTLANLPAAAAAYTADVRRAALEEAAKIADEQSLRYRSDAERSAAARQYGKWSEADGGAILAEFIARDIRALAAQPEGQ